MPGVLAMRARRPAPDVPEAAKESA